MIEFLPMPFDLLYHVVKVRCNLNVSIYGLRRSTKLCNCEQTNNVYLSRHVLFQSSRYHSAPSAMAFNRL